MQKRDLNGVLVVDKQKDWTSHDVCAFVRSRFGLKKVGHAGTLDPLATGVLVLLLGAMTKRSAEFSSCDKDYFGTLRFGIETDSHDITGKVIRQTDWKHITEEKLREVFSRFTGEVEQTPPMVSALKCNGVRLYELARAGKFVERPKRTITIYELKVEAIEWPDVHFFARVSKGTYLRTLVHDVGISLGSAAALLELRRVRSGVFSIEDALTTDDLKRLSPDELTTRVRLPTCVSNSVT